MTTSLLNLGLDFIDGAIYGAGLDIFAVFDKIQIIKRNNK